MYSQEKQIILFDTLQRKNKTATSSTWEGKKGTYFFGGTMKRASDKPISRVWLNQKHFTELFRTHNKNDFWGKISEFDSSTRVIFKITGTETLEIYRMARYG
jgi:hypothetical protein